MSSSLLGLRGLYATLLLALLAQGPVSGCERADDEAEAGPGERLHESAQSIIYGDDDRLEVYQHPDPNLRSIAQASVVAVVPIERFVRNSNGDLGLFSASLSNAFGVCTDQRFSSEPTAADCSGVLLDDDLVLTAAHCFARAEDCETYAFMFDYFFRTRDKLEIITWGDIYACKRVVARTLTPRGITPRIDFAVVQLDRKAVGRTPVQLRMTPLLQGEETAVIGCPSGLPFKIDSGGELLDSRAAALDYFLLDSDTFQGSSGSGVFDVKGQLLGTLVRGGEDYENIPDAACMVPKVVTTFEHDGGTALTLAPDGGMLEVDAEEATYVARAVDGVCTSGWPSERLCATAPRCGDGFCSVSESLLVCPVDCGCPNGACLDGGNYPAGNVGARDKSSLEGGGCSATRDGASASWLAVALVALLSRTRKRKKT